MKMIKATTNGQIEVVEAGDWKEMAELIGANYIERVSFNNQLLFGTDFHDKHFPPMSQVVMVVDETGLYKEDNKDNIVGCWLYRTAFHGHPIVGDILLVWEEIAGPDGVDFSDMPQVVIDYLEATLKQVLDA